MEESSDEESLDDDELPPANLSPIERVENFYKSDCSNECRKQKLRKDDTGEAVAPERVNLNIRTTAMMSLQSRIMRSHDMNRLHCHHVNSLMDVHGVVMTRVFIITFYARRNAIASGQGLVLIILQPAYMYQRALQVINRWTCSFHHA
jgi:hypothetical protein